MSNVKVGYIVVLAVGLILLAAGAALMFFASLGSGLGYLLAAVLLILGAIFLWIASLVGRNKKGKEEGANS